MTNQLFEVQCLAGHQGLVRGDDAEVLVRIDVQLSPGLARLSRMRAAPTRFGLLLDSSDSMNIIAAGTCTPTGARGRNADGQEIMYVTGGTTRLAALVDAGKRVVKLARPEDRVTVTHFSATVETACSVDGSDQRALAAAVERAMTFPHASTDMTAALLAALREAGEAEGAPRTVLLFTDGEPDEAKGPLEAADGYAEAGVTLSVLGFGDGTRTSYLEELAARGRGAVYSTRDSESLERELRQVFETSQQVAVSNLRARLRFAPCVTPVDLHRAHPQSQLLRTFAPTDQSAVVALGTIGAEKWVTLFVRVLVKGDQLPELGERQQLLEVTVTGDVTGEPRGGASAGGRVVIPVVGSAAPKNHADVYDAFRMAQARDLSARFEAHCRASRFDEARDVAVRLRQIYQSVGSVEAQRADADLGKTLEALDAKGQISLESLHARLNDQALSRTASGVKRPLASQTRAAPPRDAMSFGRSAPPDASVTRRGRI